MVSQFSVIQHSAKEIFTSEPANFDTNKLQPWNWPHSEPWNLHCPME
ncbi:unnamed protein product, partial [Rotaria sp. Silwood1]